MVSLSLALMFIGYNIGGRLGLFVGFLNAVILNTLVYLYGDSQLLMKMDAKKWSGQDPWGLIDLAQKYSKMIGIPTPQIWVFESDSATVFSLGQSWQRSSICFSTGLLSKLTKDELSTIVAHQVSHIHRLDTFGFGAASVFANLAVAIAQILDKVWPPNLINKNKKRRPFLSLLSPLAWSIVRLAVRDKMYFENDDMAVSLIGDRQVLAETLWKLEGMAQSRPLQIPPCTSHFFIVNPQGPTEKNWFLLAHPKIDIRVKRLVGYYPL